MAMGRSSHLHAVVKELPTPILPSAASYPLGVITREEDHGAPQELLITENSTAISSL